MGLTVSDSGGGDLTLPEPGPQAAVCAFVEDIGYDHNKFSGKWQRKLVICFELAQKMEDGRPFMLSSRYTQSLNEKANLRKDLAKWRGRDFTREELAAFDMDNIIGKGAMVNVVHKTSKGTGREYATIDGLMPLPAGMEAPKVENTEPPEWIAEQCARGNEAYAASLGAQTDEDEKDRNYSGQMSGDTVPF